MGDKHIVVENADGSDEKARWHTKETYKVSEAVAQQLEAMKTKPTGRDLRSWVEDHGGVLDDDNGKPARVSTKNNGTVLNDHYKNGEFTKSDVVRPKGAKADDHAGASLLLAVLTGGTSLFLEPLAEARAEKEGSKFTNTAPEQPAADTGTKTASKTKVTTKTTVTPKR